MDSNHDKASQSRLCYHYTTRQKMVGAARFELATIPPQTEHSTAELRADYVNILL